MIQTEAKMISSIHLHQWVLRSDTIWPLPLCRTQNILEPPPFSW